MKRLTIPDVIDIIAVVGLAALAFGVGYRFGWDIGLALVGAFLLIYAVLASRKEAAP